ncbi:MAG: hypothetical protein HZA04_02195 [Nitrospinae bacterium]|nr:hypothetical protein [Nitrospinota bacterium]
MEHQRAIGKISGLFLVPAVAGVILYLAAHLIGVKAAAVAGAIVLLCWVCALVAAALKGGVFSGFPRWAVAVFGLVTLWTLWLSSAPPYYRDDLIIHLAFPKHVLLEGAWNTLPFQPSSYSPNFLAPLNMALVNAGLDWTASFIPALYFLATALLLAHWVAVEHGEGWGAWAAGALLSLPLFFRLSTTAYNDPVAMFFSCAGAYWFCRWLETLAVEDGAKGALALAAGSVVKYNAGLLLAALLCVLFFLKRGNARAWVKMAAVNAAAVLAFCGPWWLAGGAPETGFSPFNGPIHERMVMCGENAISALASPVRVFFQGEEGSRCGFDGTLNPLFLIFGFAVFAVARPTSHRLLGGATALFMAAAVLLASIMARYFLPVIPLLVFLCAGFFAAADRRGYKAVAVICATAVIGWNVWGYAHAARSFSGWAYLTGHETKNAFLARHIPTYGATEYMNAHLKKTDTVYFVFTGNQVYYTGIRYFYDSYWDGTTLMRHFAPGNSAFAAANGLKAAGISHLLYRADLMRRYVEQNRLEVVFAEFISRHARVEYEDGAATLLALK